jgi:hypothetical protein
MEGNSMSKACSITVALFLSFGASASALAADVLETPQTDAPNISGYVEGYLGAVNWSQGRQSDTDFGYGGAARINVPFNERWNVQGDLAGDWIKVKSEDATIGMYSAALHGYWRDPGSFSVGAFANWQGTSFDGEMSDLYALMAGPQAQIYFDKVTLYGQAYFGQLRSTSSDQQFGTWGVRGVARYYMQPNLRLSAEAAYFSVDIDSGINTVALAAQGDYRFDNSPISVFGRYQFEKLSVSGTSFAFDSHKLSVGLRLAFGTGTLLDEDRSGATMDIFRSNVATTFAAD